MNIKKKGLTVIGGAGLTIVLTAAVFVFTFDINSYRGRIETAASEAIGLDIRINGKMGLSLFPLGISAKDIHALSNSVQIFSVEDLRLG